MTLVYHFTKSKWARAALVRKRLKIARLSELNDPFELLALRAKDKPTRTAFLHWKEEMNRRYGILCFCRNWHNPLLWSPYADRHRGVCLAIEVDSNYLKAVRYQKTRKEFDDRDLNEKLLEYTLYTKFVDWSYEEEMRLSTRLESPDEKDNKYYAEFGDQIRLHGVIVRPLSDLTRSDVESDLRDFNFPKDDTRLTKARLAHNSFAIVRDKRGLR